jgi:hypothetical protein
MDSRHATFLGLRHPAKKTVPSLDKSGHIKTYSSLQCQWCAVGWWKPAWLMD